jgi:hypothetical protein
MKKPSKGGPPADTGHFLLLLIMSLCFLCPPTFADQTNTIPTSVCEIVNHPKMFSKKWVRVKALVLSDGIHTTVLVDESCKSHGISMSLSEEVQRRPDVNALQAAIYQRGRPGTVGKRILASFRGRVVTHPNEIPSLILEVESVGDLQVEVDKGN